MQKIISKTYTVSRDYRTNITAVFVVVCACVALMYAVNLYEVIARTVAVKKLNAQTAILSQSVESLDSQYLKLTSSLTPDVVAKHDLTPGHVSLYISRTPSGLSRVDGQNTVALRHEL